MTHQPARVVIASKSGRLGNRLFLSAYFMANAMFRGYRLYNPALGEYARIFEGSARDPFCKFPKSGKDFEPDFSSQSQMVFFSIAESLGSFVGKIGLQGLTVLDIRNSHDSKNQTYNLCGEEFSEALVMNRLILAKGWKFRDEQNLLRFHSEIKNYFIPEPSVRLPAERVIGEARSRGDLVIGVHIRQGDYRGWKNGIHYFETEQYAHWMCQAERLFPEQKIVFLVCASDPIDRADLKGLNVVEGPGKVAADLHALSLCDKILAPPSTFSSWASYVGKVPLCMMEHHAQNVALESFVLHDGV